MLPIKMMKICCDPFTNLMNRAGQKGTSVIATSDGSRRRFVLQARPFEPSVVRKYDYRKSQGMDSEWPEILDDEGRPVPVVTVIQLPLHACPSCGCLLNTLIETASSEFDELAKSQAHLLDE